ncbi:MAG: TonB-dependent receptor [Acidobacteria bacterium]|nr:MAG: TonB-dependent receptor [Acidobacteriota bacterium]
MTRSRLGCSLFIVSSLFFLVFVGKPASAQKDAGSIVGSVKDPSGAIVANAKVTITDLDHGQATSTTSNAEGEFVVSPLRVGRYTVTVEQTGFKKAISAPISLDVQQRVAVNIVLQVGQITESVVVSGATPLLETETSELGQVVDSQRVANLPLNGRNFAQLALLTAGTAPSEPGARDEQSYGFSAGGARSLQNNFLLDGVDNNSNLTDLLNETNYVIQPPVDALAEFKVQTNAYSAEFGRGNGAIINAVIKSGTNDIHGSAWGFLRNNVLDARNYFDPVGKGAPPYEQYQFGGTFGGPVYIPHLYDGRNKTFFFVDYEGLRIHQADTQTLLLPDPVQVGGDFSALLDTTTVTGTDCNGNPTYTGEIFDTRLTQASATSPTGLCGVPIGGYTVAGFPTNIIPSGASSNRIDPLAARILALLPPANANGNGYNYIANPVETTHRANFDIRVDHKFSDKDNSFYRFSYEDQPRSIPPPFPGSLIDGGGFFSGVEDNSYRSLALSESHLFRTSLVNEFRLGYNRINSHRYQFNYNVDVSGQVGFPGVPFTPINGGLPQLTFGDGSAPTLGSPTFLPSVEIQNTYVLSDNLTWIRGRHTLKFGTEIRREEFTIFQPASPRGNEDFGVGFTDNPANPGSGGSGLASFLVGLSDGGSINNLKNVDYFRPLYSFYGQDDWKVTPKLTLNLGLRYELFTTVKERHDEQGTFDLQDPSNPTIIVPKGQTLQLTPTLASQIAVSPTGSRGLIPVDKNNFAPRVGFAYQLTPETVLRGGYGIFYGGQENGPYSNPSPGFNPPFFVTQNFNSPCGASSANPALFNPDPNLNNDCAVPGLSNAPGGIPGSAGISVGFPATALTDPNTPLLFSLSPKLVTPYMQQWNFGIERQLGKDTVLQVTYAGSKGTKLFTFYNGNQADPSPDPTAAFAPRRPVPSIDTGINLFKSDGGSKYNSLQSRLEKRFTHGISVLVTYTYSHAVDNASNANLGSQNNDGFRWFKHPEWEKGNASFDVRHRFTASYIYELPFGQGKSFLGGASGALQQVVGGWQIAGITTVSTGNWFTPQDSNGSFANSDGLQMPDVVADPNNSPHCLPGTFFNTCAFVDPPLGSFGDAGRNSVRGPGFQVWDFSVFKMFRVSERTRLEFRTEFFNIPNHTNFLLSKSGPQEGNSSTVLGASQFGFLTAARPPRQIQFSLKLSF